MSIFTNPINNEKFKEWKERMDEIRQERAAPSKGLNFFQKINSELLAKWIFPVFGTPYRKRRLPVTGGKLIDVDRILEVPWPDDIHIDVISYDGDDGEVHYISLSADGPNGDGSMHHGSLSYLPDYQSREEMLQSAREIAALVYQLTGHKPLILTTNEHREEHSGWCLGKRKTPPKGYGYDELAAR